MADTVHFDTFHQPSTAGFLCPVCQAFFGASTPKAALEQHARFHVLGEAPVPHRETAAIALIGREIPVLPDGGYVKLVDFMGSDQRIIDGARVSLVDAAAKKTQSLAGLMAYLIRNAHTSPLEHVVFTFEVYCPIFIARQWFRHRTWSFSEWSGRYGVLPDAFHVPDDALLCGPSAMNKQGSGAQLDAGSRSMVRELLTRVQRAAFDAYHTLLGLGLAGENARILLPVGTYTKFYATVDLNNLLKFIALREDGHAQAQIQVYGAALRQIAEAVVPVAMDVFKRQVLNGARFNEGQKGVLLALAAVAGRQAIVEQMDAAGLTSKSERGELLAKLGMEAEGEAA
jgi:thymidylate synthase (FAD)